MWHPVFCAGILEQSMGARNRVGIRLSYRPVRLHRLAKSIPWNRFPGSLKVFKILLSLSRQPPVLCSCWQAGETAKTESPRERGGGRRPPLPLPLPPSSPVPHSWYRVPDYNPLPPPLFHSPALCVPFPPPHTSFLSPPFSDSPPPGLETPVSPPPFPLGVGPPVPSPPSCPVPLSCHFLQEGRCWLYKSFWWDKF
jgi:hypothetical protein